MRALIAATCVAVLFLVPSGSANICSSASGCEFWDSNYHEYVLYSVDTASIDVLIVPPASPFALRDIATVRKSVDAWESGIQSYGASWLAAGLDIRPYTLGIDSVPTAALTDPEIIIVTSEHDPFLLFGIGYQTPASICLQRGGAEQVFPTHEHDGWRLMMASCRQGGLTCVALNTNFLLGGARRMYDLVSHEFGHCLGGGHVGDALDFDARTVPLSDIMSYQYNPNQVHCVSNLNVRVLEGVYANVLNQPSAASLAPGRFYAMAPSGYSQVACTNP